MIDPIVLPHSLRPVIAAALIRAIADGQDNGLALGVAARAVLSRHPELGVSEAYDLVNRLWVR